MSKLHRLARKELLEQQIRGLGWPPMDKKLYAELDTELVRVKAYIGIDEVRDRASRETERLLQRAKGTKRKKG